MNAVIKKLLALPQNLSLMVLNQNTTNIEATKYMVVVVPVKEQLRFLELYTNNRDALNEALKPYNRTENEQWYPVAFGDSPTKAMNALDKLITDVLADMSMKQFARHIVAELNKVVGSNGSTKVLTYPQLLGFS